MHNVLARWGVPILAGLLLLNIAAAVAAGSRWNWLTVAFLAPMLALNLWWWGRTGGEPRDPHQR